MRYTAPDMRGWSNADRIAWEEASEEERLRSSVSIADLVREDQEDSDTPDHFDVEYQDGEEADPDDTAAVHGLTVGTPAVVTHMRRIRDRLRSWGWTVLELQGWETRGVRPLNPQYIGQHHTAAEVDIDRILRDGRPGLGGPLANWGVHIDDVIVLIASGTANHFGVATINNDEAYGIEATGPIPLSNKGRDAFPNYRAQMALTVAIRMEHSWGVGRIKGHKEVARPDGRKPDPAFEEGRPGDGYPSPYPEMDRYRASCNVTSVLKHPASQGDEIDMADLDDIRKIFGLRPGQNMALGVLGQVDNAQWVSRSVNPNDANSNAAKLDRLLTAMAAQNDLLVKMAGDLGDDEPDLKAAVTASTTEIKAAIAALDDPEANEPAPTS